MNSSRATRPLAKVTTRAPSSSLVSTTKPGAKRRCTAPKSATASQTASAGASSFAARLGERGLPREVMAAAAGLSAADLALMFKDQREISAGEVAVFAELLGVEAPEVAARAGISTPIPGQPDAAEARIAAL